MSLNSEVCFTNIQCCWSFCYWYLPHVSGSCGTAWRSSVTERKHVDQSLENNSSAGCRRWKEMDYYKAVFPAPSTEKCKHKWWTTEEEKDLSEVVHVTVLNQSQRVIQWRFLLEKTWLFVSKYIPVQLSQIVKACWKCFQFIQFPVLSSYSRLSICCYSIWLEEVRALILPFLEDKSFILYADHVLAKKVHIWRLGSVS